MRILVLLVAVTTAGLLTAAPAGAASLTFSGGPPCTEERADDGNCRPGEATYRADAGERDELTIFPGRSATTG